jgi:N-glycosylase/DNA lyase
MAQTLDNGQAFRWREVADGFSGIAHGRRLDIAYDSAKQILTLKNVKLSEFETLWCDYFDFSRSYENLRTQFSCENETLQKAVSFSQGLRLMRQDVWEVLISFILSQNSNIPRIKQMIERLCENFGEKLPCGGFAFPTAQALAALSAQDLAPIKCGYRTAYILDAAQRTASGIFNPAELCTRPTEEIRKALLEIRGVGAKVADCVLLFGFSRTECYPVDVWIKRVLAQYFPDGLPKSISENAGIAQQFLFHYIRNA